MENDLQHVPVTNAPPVTGKLETRNKGFQKPAQQTGKNKIANNWSSRRRPTNTTRTSNLALEYEKVAEIKRQVMQCQWDILQAQKEDMLEKIQSEKQQRALKEKRDSEGFALKKRCLQLDVQIKEAQLEKLKNL